MKLILPFLIGSTVASALADVSTFSLVNADTDQPVAAFDPLMDGAAIDLSTLATNNLSIRANVDAPVGSVVFELTGAATHSQTESVAPYALFGDTGGDYAAWQPALGSYSLEAQGFSEAGGGGKPKTGHPDDRGNF
jgi:hypothetical protein